MDKFLIRVYDLFGRCLGSATAEAEVTNVSSIYGVGETVIVKIGERAVKVVVK